MSGCVAIYPTRMRVLLFCRRVCFFVVAVLLIWRILYARDFVCVCVPDRLAFGVRQRLFVWAV